VPRRGGGIVSPPVSFADSPLVRGGLAPASSIRLCAGEPTGHRIRDFYRKYAGRGGITAKDLVTPKKFAIRKKEL